MLALKDVHLFKQASYINGEWMHAKSEQTITITSPVDQSLLGTVPICGRDEVKYAIESAYHALPAWRNKTAKERAQLLKHWYELIMQHAEDLAMLLSMEQGKPIAEALAEVQYGASFIEWFAEEAKRAYGDVIPSPSKDRRIIVIKQPVGVVAAITPWNFPNAMITRKCAPALAAGCSIVIKPAEITPFSALALAELAARAGIPAGVFNIVTGSPEEIGDEFTTHPWVRKLSFTGSTRIGKLLMQKASATVKKISLELGGNAPFIVFEDADLSAAVRNGIAAKFRNAGQTCVCANRFLVQASIYEEFIGQLTIAMQNLKVGHPLNEDTQIGPLINQAAIDKVMAHIEDACANGAGLVLGGKLHALGGTYFLPTLLRDVTPRMRVTQEETFGPVVAIMPFQDEAEAIHLANATEYGLASYICSQNHSRIWRVAEQLEAGIVGVNVGLISTEVAPFGGVKESGIGREGSKYGLDEYLELKYLALGD